jgi:hypothetical protein
MLIQGKSFRHCNIVGPAVLTIIDNCGFIQVAFKVPKETGSEGALLETQAKGTFGMIGLEGCSFELCTFEAISFAGGKEFIDNFRKNVSYEPTRQP